MGVFQGAIRGELGPEYDPEAINYGNLWQTLAVVVSQGDKGAAVGFTQGTH